MMPTVGRLKTRPEFLKVAAARSKWVAPGLILQARRREIRDAATPETAERDRTGDRDKVRVGFTVSRKVGGAVERNRARRRLRAAANQVLPEHGLPGHDYVLIGRGGTLSRRYADLVADLRTALDKVGAAANRNPRPPRRRRDRKEGA